MQASSRREEIGSRSTSLVTAILWAIFIPTGIVNTMLGPMLPLLSKRWTLTDSQAGYLFSAQFVGSMVGVLLSSKLVSRNNYRQVVFGGIILMAVGAGLLPSTSSRLGMAAVFIYGLGLGLTIPTVNLLAAKINAARSLVALNYLNLFWGLGAVACPFLVALSQRDYQTVTRMQYGLAAVLLVLAVMLIGTKISDSADERRSIKVPQESSSIWKQPMLPILAGLFFLYVATESGVAGWIAYHADRSQGGRGTLWVMVPAFFWGALLLGRALGHLLLRFVSQMSALRIHLLTSAIGILVLVLSHNLSTILCGSIAVGLGLSTVFPFYIHILSKTFGSRASEAGSILFAMAGLGGACGPSIVGLVSQRFSLGTGFLVPLLGCLFMLVLCAPNSKWWRGAGEDVYSRAN